MLVWAEKKNPLYKSRSDFDGNAGVMSVMSICSSIIWHFTKDGEQVILDESYVRAMKNKQVTEQSLLPHEWRCKSNFLSCFLFFFNFFFSE